ncbi:MAG: hypothetical protein CMB64_06505 [Euryarchaeota archaeon]|nr:hypothetical protein [Euryarchaeota archaeon]
MRWLKKFKDLWSVEETKIVSPEEVEREKIKILEKKYLEKKASELKQISSILDDEETQLPEPNLEKPKEYDVGEIDVEDLFDEGNLESHYELNVINAQLEGSDNHLIDVEQIEP